MLGSVLTLVFVLVFNFFLFRVVQTDPIGSLFRGRNVPQETLDNLRVAFGLDQPLGTQFLLLSERVGTAQLRDLLSDPPTGVERDRCCDPGDRCSGRSLGDPLRCHRHHRRDHRCLAEEHLEGSLDHLGDDGVLLDARFLARHDPPRPVCRCPGVVPRWRGLHCWDPTRAVSPCLIDQAYHMFLPALTLTLAYLGEYTLVTRSSLLDVMGEDYLTVARAKGLRDVAVRNRHAVPNALLPVVTLTAINFGFVLSGAIAVEAVFSWPGLGKLTADAIRGPDLPMLQALFLLFSAAVIVFNLIADLTYSWLDPRVEGQ